MAIRSATATKTNHASPAAYVCRARKLEQRGGRCTAPITLVRDVDARVWSIVSRALVSPELAAAVTKRFAARAADQRDWSADVVRYEAKLAQLEKASAAIAKRFRNGLLSEAAFDIELEAAGRERRSIAAQLDAARDAASAHHVPQEGPEQWLHALRRLGLSATPEARQRVVRALVPRGAATFAGDDVELVLEIDEPAPTRTPIALVTSAGYRMSYGTMGTGPVRLRLVAQAVRLAG